ncbi:MAG: GAF domain-containing protein, partial [Terriglobia bacterium]
LELLGEAHLAEKQFEKAEKVYQNLLENSPTAVGPLVVIAMEYTSRGSVPQGLRTLKGIEQQLTISHRQEALVQFAKQISEVDHAHIPVLEYTAHLLDRLHQDTPLTKTLNRLFELHFSAGDYSKAGETLEQLIAIDVYSSECSDKLDRLQGKLDAAMWNELASRMGLSPKPGQGAEAFPQPAGGAPGSEPQAGHPAEGGGNLRDLVLQAEIFLQYNLKDKALERLEQIAKLFPHEDEKDDDVRALFERAGYKPPYEPTPTAPAPASSPEPQDMRSYVSRMTEVSRNLSRQGAVKGVLSTAVNDIGRHWQVSRCVVGLLAPNRPPSMALEYISPGIQPSDPMLIGKLLMGLQQIVVDQGSSLVVENVAQTPALSSLQNFLKTLQVESLVAILLREESQPMGLLVLEQCGGRRAWKLNELSGLEALAEQIVLSVINVRLRNLMRTLAVTDERSGLLHRDSYIPCLLSEAERMQRQQKPLTGALLQFSPTGLPPPGTQPPQSLEEFLQGVSGTIVAHLRQNDIAIRYGPLALALVLPGTSGKEAVTVVEKLRRLVTATDPTKGGPPRMTAFIGEAVQERGMENADVVTELINRLEMAVESVPLAGDASTRLLGPAPFRQP